MSQRIHLLGTLMTVLTIAQPAAGYNLRKAENGQTIRWNRSELQVLINPAGIEGGEGEADAVRAAFATWTSAGMPFKVQSAVDRSATIDAKDGRNTVAWVTKGWKYGKEVVAMTVAMYKQKSGLVSETDIALNATDLSWTLSPETATQAFDIQNILTHEVGHFFGLGHDEQHADSAMYPISLPGERIKRTLSADDRAGIVALIGEMGLEAPVEGAEPYQGTADAPAGTDGADLDATAGCSVGGARPDASWLLILLVVAGLVLRRQVARQATALRPRRLGIVAVVGAVLLLGASAARATVIQDLSLEQMTARADRVLQGVVVASRSTYAEGIIVTEHRIRAVRCHKGPCEAEVILRTPGGVVGDTGMWVEGMPRLRAGEMVFLFGRGPGRELAPIGLGLGVFRLARGVAVRDLSGLSLLGRGPLRAGQLERLPLGELEQRIQRALRRPATSPPAR